MKTSIKHYALRITHLCLLLILPLTVVARDKQDDTKYLAGAVPTDANGIVTFHQAFAVPGKTAAEVYSTMKRYMDGVEQAAPRSLEAHRLNMQDLRTKYIEADPQAGSIVLRCEEFMLFKKAVLKLDFARFRYHYQVKCTDGRCDMTVTQISYYYEEEMDGTNGRTYKAEEWITDREAISKRGDKLLPYSGKFRRKTVDRVAELFEGARQAFETPEPEEAKEQRRATKLLD